jgi:hypothetical protein
VNATKPAARLQVQQLFSDPLHPFAQQGYSQLVKNLMLRLDANHDPGASGQAYAFSPEVGQQLVMQLCTLGIIPYFQDLLQKLGQCKLTPPPDAHHTAASSAGSEQPACAQEGGCAEAANSCALQAAASPADSAVRIHLHLHLIGSGSIHASSPGVPSSITGTTGSISTDKSGSLPELCVLDAAWYLHQLGFILDVMLPALCTDALDPHCRQEYLHALSQLLSAPDILTDLIDVAMSPEMLAAAGQEVAAGRAADASMGPTASCLIDLVQYGIFARFAFTSAYCVDSVSEEKVLWEGLRKKMVCCLNSKQNRLHLEDLVLCSPLQGARCKQLKLHVMFSCSACASAVRSCAFLCWGRSGSTRRAHVPNRQDSTIHK